LHFPNRTVLAFVRRIKLIFNSIRLLDLITLERSGVAKLHFYIIYCNSVAFIYTMA